MLSNNPALLKAVICQAAEDAYYEEIIEAGEEDRIGPGEEYASKEDWMSSKITSWAEDVGRRFVDLTKELGGTEESRGIAIKYHSLEIGESFRLGDGMKVRRVPGGWLHSQIDRDAVISVFVPLSKEFRALAGVYDE